MICSILFFSVISSISFFPWSDFFQWLVPYHFFHDLFHLNFLFSVISLYPLFPWFVPSTNFLFSVISSISFFPWFVPSWFSFFRDQFHIIFSMICSIWIFSFPWFVPLFFLCCLRTKFLLIYSWIICMPWSSDVPIFLLSQDNFPVFRQFFSVDWSGSKNRKQGKIETLKNAKLRSSASNRWVSAWVWKLANE